MSENKKLAHNLTSSGLLRIAQLIIPDSILKMINPYDFIKSKMATENRRRLLENFFSLSLLQAASYVLPIITVPYLTRTLGTEKFGLLAFAQSLTGYFGILVDYGFSFSATREISIHREDRAKVSEIFCSIMLIRFVFLLISAIILAGIVFTFAKFRADAAVYYLSFGMICGAALFPIWLFQGMEQMKYITFLNILARLLFTVLVFVFVRTAQDYLYVPALSTLGALVSGLLALWIVRRDFGVTMYLPSMKQIEHQLREGWHIFSSMAFISLYTTSNTVLLGLLTNNTVVGYFAAADKLVGALKSLTVPISQTFFPYFSKMSVQNAERAKAMLKKMLFAIGGLTFAISLSGCLLAPFIVRILFGPAFQPSILALRIMVFVVFAIGVNNVLGAQGLLAFGYKKELNLVIIICATLHIVLFSAATYLFGLLGAASIVLFTEVLVCLLQYPVLRSKKLI